MRRNARLASHYILSVPAIMGSRLRVRFRRRDDAPGWPFQARFRDADDDASGAGFSAARMPAKTELGRASSRWNRSSQPMQCIGKTPANIDVISSHLEPDGGRVYGALSHGQNLPGDPGFPSVESESHLNAAPLKAGRPKGRQPWAVDRTERN